MRSRSELELLLEYHIKVCGLPRPQTEYQFDPTRRWRLDFYWDKPRLAVEVEGGIWTHGRHSRGGKAFIADCDKYNALTLAGIRLLRFTEWHIKQGIAVAQIEEVLG